MEVVINNAVNDELSIVKNNADERIKMKIKELELKMKSREQNKLYDEIKTKGKGSLTVLKMRWYSAIGDGLDNEEKEALERMIVKKAKKTLRLFWGTNILVNAGIMTLGVMISPLFFLLGIVSGSVDLTLYHTGPYFMSETFLQNCANVLEYEKYREKIEEKNRK